MSTVTQVSGTPRQVIATALSGGIVILSIHKMFFAKETAQSSGISPAQTDS